MHSKTAREAGGAILAKAIFATLPAAQRQPDFLPFAGSAREPEGHSMCTVDLWRHRDSVEHCSFDFLSWSDQFGSTTATGFDNDPLKRISNIVITCFFWLLSAFRVRGAGVCVEVNM